MKYLKIEDKKGFYRDGDSYQEIDKIDKKGLIGLLNAAESDDFELDPYDENLIGNKAHQIIYENIYNKLQGFLSDKVQFKTEVERLYQEAINKHSVEVKDEDDEPELKQVPDNEENDEMRIEDIPF